MTRVSTLLLGAALTLGSSAIAAHAQTATPPPKNPANSATGTAGFTKPGTTEGGAAYVGPIISKWGKAVTPENAWRGYPRPQMARDTWMYLNGQWDYAIARQARHSRRQWTARSSFPSRSNRSSRSYIGRAHFLTPVTIAHLVFLLLLFF